MLAENAHADCFDRVQRRLHEGEHQIEIVNHQIEHDADIGGASRERPHALGADEPGAESGR